MVFAGAIPGNIYHEISVILNCFFYMSIEEEKNKEILKTNKRKKCECLNGMNKEYTNHSFLSYFIFFSK